MLDENELMYTVLKDYQPDLSTYDELRFQGKGEVLPYWDSFFEAFQSLTPEELEKKKFDMLRMLKENGVTYNIYDDPTGAARNWKLDPIPNIIDGEEWETIQSGLIQRATILNLIAKDIYGPQFLLKNKIIPAELIFQHPGYIRQCMSIDVPGGCFLNFYAADMARSKDGQLWIIGDRTQAPSGSGYALENRMALSTAFPEFFKNEMVAKIGAYFNSVYKELCSNVPHGIDNPKIVVLTSGPGNETYFEHAYLSNYLGITLVQGEDLMVKGDYLWLKTLSGLERIDVILRRLDDNFCDPLELRSDSLLGVPGLLHVARSGNVVIKNAIGSSILENPGLIPFLPNVAAYFEMGELILPSLATWWCGQEKELKFVLENIDNLVIKRIYRSDLNSPSVIDVGELKGEEKANLILQIQEKPYLYVGQEKVNFSSIPAYSNRTIHAGRAVFRSFLAHSDDSYVVMPGGLTRAGDSKNNIIITNQSGGTSKDTWILSENIKENLPIMHKVAQTFSMRQPIALPSHTAESLFWLGRYTERMISNGRFLRTVMQFLMQSDRYVYDNDTSESATIILLRALTCFTFTYPGFVEMKDAQLLENPWEEIDNILFDPKRAGSYLSNFQRFKNTFLSVREFWSNDIWRVFHHLDQQFSSENIEAITDVQAEVRIIDDVVSSMFAFLGLNRESANRLQGWTIFDVGRKIEQCFSVIALLQFNFTHKKVDSVEHELIESVLICNQNLNAYRYTFKDFLQIHLMLDLLLKDLDNPRSLAYLLEKLQKYVKSLPRNQYMPQSDSQLDNCISTAIKMVEHANVVTLSKSIGELEEYENLQSFLDKMYHLMLEISDLISKAYFKHTIVPKQLYKSDLIY
ncbi:circularly permuted type 2 ATP-grasp protein [Rhizosphaericola mali]|uniref:Circularly permuted type 2 ATP-grasp protein n=1 Tax=Rhizosphaericola mali TaxID=2545455 RepID=A0A5P2G8P3_9BACT|nr:circularly permuted type 2 ATP-grasp protein [Rhizosphaericola mali]QES90110.1 circularly permuted type 2 ATP-grasp protein [Rhizosphaericola mali]